MNYGMSLAASGALTSLYRIDVLANNVANMMTPGFKADLPAIRQRDVARTEDRLPFMPSSTLLERLGGGVMAAGNRMSFEQGSLITTGRPLDLAVQGDGFFVVRDQSDGGTERYLLTRNGSFTRDHQGRLASASTGQPVMDVTNRPIVLSDDAQVLIGADGTVRQNGQVVAQVQLAAVSDTSRLRKLGDSMFVAPTEVIGGRGRAAGEIRQGALEGSSVDAIAMTMAITEAQKAAEANTGMIQAYDRLMDRTINGLGRTA